MTKPQAPATQVRKPLPQVITAKRVRIAWLRGEVTPLSPQIDNCVQYLGHWWINDDTERIRITAPAPIALMDRQKERSTALYRELHAKRAG